MIFCNGVPKTGTHLLCSHCERMGLRKYPRIIKGTNKRKLKGLTAMDLMPHGDHRQYYAHCHVGPEHDLPGPVFVIFRNPRNTLISWMRFRNKQSPYHALRSFTVGGDFISTYNSFLPWREKADAVFYFETMPKTNEGPTYTGEHSNWEDHWDDEMEMAWEVHGGYALENELGYSNVWGGK